MARYDKRFNVKVTNIQMFDPSYISSKDDYVNKIEKYKDILQDSELDLNDMQHIIVSFIILHINFIENK